MPSAQVFGTLLRHFFRRLFDNDSISADADTLTTAVRFVCGLAVPGLMVAFWLIKGYPHEHVWKATTIHASYVMYSFAAVGCVTALQWEPLFPDHYDLLNLSPLPVSSPTMMAAKAAAIGGFVIVFAAGANILGGLLLPLASGEHVMLHYWAHILSTTCAGLTSAFSILVVQSLAILLTPRRWSGLLFPVLQTFIVAAWFFSLLLLLALSPHWEAIFRGIPDQGLFPPLWFLGLYEVSLRTGAATSEAHSLARTALVSVPVSLAAAMVTYPLAWQRRRSMVIDGRGSAPRTSGPWFRWIASALAPAEPPERAVSAFISSTVARLSQYQIRLSAYLGVALAVSAALVIRLRIGNGLEFGVARESLRLVLPFLLFCTVSGLHVAFLLPVDLRSRWIFRLWPTSTGASLSAVRRWVLCCCAAITAMTSAGTYLAHEPWCGVVVGALIGAAYASMLSDLFFFFSASIPFTRPRLPGRTSLPLTLVTYVFLLPAWTGAVYWLQCAAERRAWLLLPIFASAIAVHYALRRARASAYHPATDDPFIDEEQEEYLRLNLSDG